MYKENHLPGEREPVGEGRMDGEDYGGSDIYGWKWYNKTHIFNSYKKLMGEKGKHRVWTYVLPVGSQNQTKLYKL